MNRPKKELIFLDHFRDLVFLPYMSNHIDHKNIFVVVPVFNENKIIRQVIEELCGKYQVIVMDDGSEMPVSPQLKGLPIYLLRHPVNLGQGAALQTGIEYALSKKAQLIVTFDGDGQHDVADIDHLLQPL